MLKVAEISNNLLTFSMSSNIFLQNISDDQSLWACTIYMTGRLKICDKNGTPHNFC